MVMMHEYKIEIEREGRWWLVYIPDIDGLTQARRLAEAPTMAREYIALDRGIPVGEISVEIASIRTEEPAFRELLETARQIESIRAQANALERKSTERARESRTGWSPTAYPSAILRRYWKSRPQRVSQLANS